MQSFHRIHRLLPLVKYLYTFLLYFLFSYFTNTNLFAMWCMSAHAVIPFYSNGAVKYLTPPYNSISKILRLPHMEWINELNSRRNVIFDDCKKSKNSISAKTLTHTHIPTPMQVSTCDTLGPYAYGIKLVQRRHMKRQSQQYDNIAGDQLKILKLDFPLHGVTQMRSA